MKQYKKSKSKRKRRRNLKIKQIKHEQKYNIVIHFFEVQTISPSGISFLRKETKWRRCLCHLEKKINSLANEHDVSSE